MAFDPADITYMLSGSEDVNLPEGMFAKLAVTATDPVPMATDVMDYARQGRKQRRRHGPMSSTRG